MLLKQIVWLSPLTAPGIACLRSVSWVPCRLNQTMGCAPGAHLMCLNHKRVFSPSDQMRTHFKSPSYKAPNVDVRFSARTVPPRRSAPVMLHCSWCRQSPFLRSLQASWTEMFFCCLFTIGLQLALTFTSIQLTCQKSSNGCIKRKKVYLCKV